MLKGFHIDICSWAADMWGESQQEFSVAALCSRSSSIRAWTYLPEWCRPFVWLPFGSKGPENPLQTTGAHKRTKQLVATGQRSKGAKAHLPDVRPLSTRGLHDGSHILCLSRYWSVINNSRSLLVSALHLPFAICFVRALWDETFFQSSGIQGGSKCWNKVVWQMMDAC